MSAIDQCYRIDARSLAIVEELGEITTVCRNCVRGQASLIGEPTQVRRHFSVSPCRYVGNFHVLMLLASRPLARSMGSGSRSRSR